MKKKTSISNQAKKDAITAYIMIFPVVVLLAIFVIWPLINSIRWSFFNWSFYREPEFVGFNNFRMVLQDKYFLKSLVVGLKWVAMVVPAGFILSFFIATYLKSLKNSRGSVFMKIAVYVPNVVSVVVASMIFVFLVDVRYGAINVLLKYIGMDPIPFLSKPATAMPAVAVVGVWLSFGMQTLIMLAGLNDIPNTYYEAATIDGAGFFQKTFYVTLPCMKNIFLFLLVTGVTGAIQEFQIMKLMTNGGPLQSTTTPNLLIYQHFTSDPTMGYTMAAALLMFAIMMMLSVVLFRVIQSDKMD